MANLPTVYTQTDRHNLLMDLAKKVSDHVAAYPDETAVPNEEAIVSGLRHAPPPSK